MKGVLVRNAFVDVVETAPLILTDGGIETRTIYEFGLTLPEPLEAVALLDDERGRDALAQIYTSYLEVGRAAGIPMIFGTPPFRAGATQIAMAGLPARDVERINAGAAHFSRALRAAEGEYANDVFLAGVLGPAHDAYTASAALDEERAERAHRPQAEALAEAGVDFLFFATLPAVSEAIGAARALGSTGLPYVLSFVTDGKARVLDGTDLFAAFDRIDASVAVPPLYYLVNCVGPKRFAASLRGRKKDVKHSRLRGLKANASELSPQELAAAKHLESESPAAFAREMLALHERFGLRVLGGCCGTNERHIRALAEALKP